MIHRPDVFIECVKGELSGFAVIKRAVHRMRILGR